MMRENITYVEGCCFTSGGEGNFPSGPSVTLSQKQADSKLPPTLEGSLVLNTPLTLPASMSLLDCSQLSKSPKILSSGTSYKRR